MIRRKDAGFTIDGLTHRRGRTLKRRIERVEKRQERRAERRFEASQQRLWELREARYGSIESEAEYEYLYGFQDDAGDTYLRPYQADAFTYENEQFEDDWDLEFEEDYDRHRRDDEEQAEYYRDIFGDDAYNQRYGRGVRVYCQHCDTSNESDATFCKCCGGRVRQEPVIVEPEFKPWSSHGRW